MAIRDTRLPFNGCAWPSNWRAIRDWQAGRVGLKPGAKWGVLGPPGSKPSRYFYDLRKLAALDGIEVVWLTPGVQGARARVTILDDLED